YEDGGGQEPSAGEPVPSCRPCCPCCPCCSKVPASPFAPGTCGGVLGGGGVVSLWAAGLGEAAEDSTGTGGADWAGGTVLPSFSVLTALLLDPRLLSSVALGHARHACRRPGLLQ